MFATSRPAAVLKPSCDRCGMEVSNVSTSLCQSCSVVVRFENPARNTLARARKRAAAEGWDFDNPLSGWPGES